MNFDAGCRMSPLEWCITCVWSNFLLWRSLQCSLKIFLECNFSGMVIYLQLLAYNLSQYPSIDTTLPFFAYHILLHGHCLEVFHGASPSFVGLWSSTGTSLPLTCFLGQVLPARTIPPCPASCMASNGLHAIDQFALVLALGEAVRLDLPKDGGFPPLVPFKRLKPDSFYKNNWKTAPFQPHKSRSDQMTTLTLTSQEWMNIWDDAVVPALSFVTTICS